MDRQKTPPVSVGDELDVTIEGIGAKGDGVAKVEGFVIFVPDAKISESCRVRIIKVIPGKMAFANRMDI